MTVYQPVHIVTDGKRTELVRVDSVYTSAPTARRALKKWKGFTLDTTEIRTGGFVQEVELVEGR